jgi:hypothetical protein
MKTGSGPPDKCEACGLPGRVKRKGRMKQTLLAVPVGATAGQTRTAILCGTCTAEEVRRQHAEMNAFIAERQRRASLSPESD